MPDYRIFPTTNGPATLDSDATQYTFGVEFYVTSAATLTQAHYWRATIAQNGPITYQLYERTGATTGTAVSGATGTFTLATGWMTSTLATPVTLTPNTRYRMGVLIQGNSGYSATGSYFTTGGGAVDLVNGPLVCPSAANVPSSHQGSFTGSSSLTFPSGSFSGGNYWIDVTVNGGPVAPYHGNSDARASMRAY